MDISIIIPARYNSSRYKGKPLVKLLGREMILRVADICLKVVKKDKLFVATDDDRIAKKVSENGFNFIMTSKKCLTGTDRVAEVSRKINSDIYINVQGDEPTIRPSDIKKIIDSKIKFPNHVICGYDKIHKSESPFSLNLPKVVVNEKNELIYISRLAIPGSKKKVKKKNYLKQVCIYAFSKKELKKFNTRNQKGKLEKIEDIEILRFFEVNTKIKMVKLNSSSIAIDEKSDVKKAEKIIKKSLKKNL